MNCIDCKIYDVDNEYCPVLQSIIPLGSDFYCSHSQEIREDEFGCYLGPFEFLKEKEMMV